MRISKKFDRQYLHLTLKTTLKMFILLIIHSPLVSTRTTLKIRQFRKTHKILLDFKFSNAIQWRNEHTWKFKSGVDKRRVEHPHCNIFNLVRLSSQERSFEGQFTEHPMRTLSNFIEIFQFKFMIMTWRAGAISTADPKIEQQRQV